MSGSGGSDLVSNWDGEDLIRDERNASCDWARQR